MDSPDQPIHRPHMTSAVIIILLALITTNTSAETPYYRWVDEQGVVNYSQKPPIGVSAELISQEQAFGRRRPESPSSQVAPAQASPAQNQPEEVTDAVPEDEEYRQIEARMREEVAAQKRTNCLQARKNLESFTSRGRIRVRDDEGNYTIISDSDKQKRIERFQDQIRQFCY